MNLDAFLYVAAAMLQAAQLSIALDDVSKWFEPKTIFAMRAGIAIFTAGVLSWKTYRSTPKAHLALSPDNKPQPKDL